MCCVLHSYCKTNDIYLKKETEVIYFLSVLQHDSTVRFFFTSDVLNNLTF